MENSVKTWAETFTEYDSSPIAHTRILPIVKPTLFTVLTPGAQGFDRRLLRFSDQLMSTRSPYLMTIPHPEPAQVSDGIFDSSYISAQMNSIEQYRSASSCSHRSSDLSFLRNFEQNA